MDDSPAQRARAAIDAARVSYEVTTHGPVRSLEEAAHARGLTPDRILKSLVVRRADDDFLFVLVPGGHAISWPRLRALLGVSRLSMPDAAVALEVTGYPRGTITPFGSLRPGRSSPMPRSRRARSRSAAGTMARRSRSSPARWSPR